MRSLVTLFVLLAACEPALPQGGPDAGTDGGSTTDGGTSLITTRTDGTSFLSTIDATNSKVWVGLDLDTGRETSFDPATWDLALSRFHIRSRGGASGDGGVQVAVLVDAGFADVLAAPDGGFLEDQADGLDENTEIDTVFESVESWYAYDPMTHILSPRPLVYVVRSDANAFFKVHLEGYYDVAGTPGIVTLRWERLP